MARPKLKYSVKVERLADTLGQLRVGYRNDEIAADPDALQGFERFDDPVFSPFFDAQDALVKLSKILEDADK